MFFLQIRRMQQEDENVVYIFEDTTVEEEVVQDCAPPEGRLRVVWVQNTGDFCSPCLQ